MKTADQQMGAVGDDKEARKESMADVHMEEDVCEGQDLIEAVAGLACVHQEVGFIDGGDPAFKDAHGGPGPINKDDRTSSRIQKASKEACLVGDHVYGNQSTLHKGASIGPRHFTSSREMLKFFNQLLNGWPLNYNINKYEHMMLEDLLKKGHPNFSEKIGTGIQSFQVRINKAFDGRCFHVITIDGPMNDFSYRKCVNNILSLPKNLKSKFGRVQNEKGCNTQENGNARVCDSRSQPNSRSREREPNGNGQYDNSGRGRNIQGKGNSSRQK
ncbi:hypothetical protein GOP47_0003444 [Adiantum capillus-veneris]|uniref:Uncharacterized protein n=1 Tax=Adiantum capillus-veneris TaxID=13818 RepID=A0A9D4VBZ4_ADICA|nr:hypothetical protein GOP47_0003444 [Adiantum capillus-veneris]